MRKGGLAVGSAVLLACGAAYAAPNDVALNDLVVRDATGKVQLNPSTGLPQGDDEAFRGLATEMGFVFSPHLLEAAETPGHIGFDIGVEYNLSFIQSGNDYWAKATERGRSGGSVPPVLHTLGVRVRKGLPLSFELGGGGTYLFESHMYALGADLRWALNEGFVYLPDLTVYAAVNRLLGNDQIDLTVVATGAELSKTFGLFGSMRLAPFAAYRYVMINAASAVIDPDPAWADDITGNFTFDQVFLLDNGYHGVAAGLRLGSFIFDLTLEGDFHFAGNQSVHQFSSKLSFNF